MIREICQETVQIMKEARISQIKAPENLLKTTKLRIFKIYLNVFQAITLKINLTFLRHCDCSQK